jgi:hypothetical protein
VPEGKYVLFPVANGLVKPQPTNDVECDYALDRVARGMEAVVAPYATLDGRQVRDIGRHRERTGTCFDPASTGRKVSAADGYWVMLGPLKAGKHVLKFGNNEDGPAGKDVTVLLTVASDAKLSSYETWPGPGALGGIRESAAPGGGVQISWNSLVASMPVTPDFGASAVMRRFAALLARDGRYTALRATTKPMGADLSLSVAPRDVAAFDSRATGIASEFSLPIWIWADPPQGGKVRLVAGNLVLRGAAQAVGVEVSRDIERFFYQALDKRVAVSDHEMRAVMKAVNPTWEDLTRHRLPRPKPGAAEQAATQRTLQSLNAMMARASEATQPAPGRVYLKGEYPGSVRISPDGMTVEWCCGGAYAAAKASRAYSYGKYYFEAELKMPPQRGKPAGFTNVGVAYGDGSALSDENAYAFQFSGASRYRGGMVGLALDLDARRLHVHVDGAWLNGAPGSGAGKPLKAARAFTAILTVGSPQGQGEEPDAWTANFGARPFRFAPPPGYAAYDQLGR